MTEEIGKGLNISNEKQMPTERSHLPVVYRLEGTETLTERTFSSLKCTGSGTITNTDLLTGGRTWDYLLGACESRWRIG